MVWSDEDNRALIAEHFNWFLKTYDDYPHWIMRVDAIRPFLLYHYGGIYADLDVECLRTFDLLRSGEVPHHLTRRRPRESVGLVLGLEKRLLTDVVCSNAIMGSRPKHPFWLSVVEAMATRSQRKPSWYESKQSYVLKTTGPELLDAVYRERAQTESLRDTLLLDARVLCPIGWWEQGLRTDLSDSIAVHRYTSSWMTTAARTWQRSMRRIFR